MASDTIRRLLFTPPVAVARLGGSTTPMVAFSWGPGDPHTVAETRRRLVLDELEAALRNTDSGCLGR